MFEFRVRIPPSSNSSSLARTRRILESFMEAEAGFMYFAYLMVDGEQHQLACWMKTETYLSLEFLFFT